jgi:sigma-B regulation protein RsbU (phosphoserine phosphatase)
VARFTAYIGGVEALLLLLKWIFRQAGATVIAVPLAQWSRFVGFVLFILLAFLALRWFRRHVMWSVRNRLIVTYLFIGVLPIVLVVLIATLSVFLLAGQLSSFLAASEIQAQLENLHAENAASAQLLATPRSSKNAEHLPTNDTIFPGRTVQLLPASSQPQWIKDGFRGLVLDGGQVYLRACDLVNSGNEKLIVVSSVPFDRTLLSKIATGIGPLSFYVVPKENSEKDNNVNIDLREGVVSINGKPAAGISAGVLPEARNRWDKEVTFYSVIKPLDWKTGTVEKNEEAILGGSMRASSLYARLSTSTNEWWTEMVSIALAVLAGLFGLILLIAWLIGIRLTRTVTYSVSNLYKATEHINRGDFTHRIKVREKDQLGALQTAFNSMTESLQKLIAEQKEKERLQSELEIAHEVQSQLFPQDVSGTRTLELYGRCRPARIVSGDYYDFLSYGAEQMGIAVGDISGKGISAALLMATIHSAVRAYEQEQLTPAGAMSSRPGTARTTAAPRIVRPSPAQMLWLLNRHLYQSTQPEKYATLFLGFYDDESRRLTYSNAGHLPPIILGQDGSTRRLDTGGTVVGLFDELGYEEQTVSLNPGDIFIAFSDGMTEPENEFGEFGEERLIETVYSCRHLSLDRITENAIGAVQDWIGSVEQPDDVTLVLARRIA